MTAKIKLNAASGGGSFSLQAPSSSANNRVITLPDVADGTLLTNQSTGLGKILQVVSTHSSTIFSTTNTSNTDTGLSATITPSSSSNKILILGTFSVGGSQNCNHAFYYYNGSSLIAAASNANVTNQAAFSVGVAHPSGGQYLIQQVALNFLYTSNTTSATTIKLYAKADSGTLYLNRYGHSTAVGGTSSITVMEVAA